MLVQARAVDPEEEKCGAPRCLPEMRAAELRSQNAGARRVARKTSYPRCVKRNFNPRTERRATGRGRAPEGNHLAGQVAARTGSAADGVVEGGAEAVAAEAGRGPAARHAAGVLLHSSIC